MMRARVKPDTTRTWRATSSTLLKDSCTKSVSLVEYDTRDDHDDDIGNGDDNDDDVELQINLMYQTHIPFTVYHPYLALSISYAYLF